MNRPNYRRIIMKKLFIAALVITLSLYFNASAFAQGISSDDFLPPVQAKTPEQSKQLLEAGTTAETKVEQIPQLKTEAVAAPTAQEAINTVVNKHEIGCKMIKTGSGFGWVATGMGTYRKMDNPVATRISQRNAFVAAFMMAKAKLAETLNGTTNEGKDFIRESLVLLNKENESLKSLETSSEESLAQAVQMLLKGFVIYEIHDDFANSTVYTSIVTTPKTCGKYSRPDANSISSPSLKEGLDALFVEINKGLVAPVGGRIIFVPQTKEIAYVGFGSAVVNSDSNAALQAKLNASADRIATMRATDALCGMIIGDNTRWQGNVDEKTGEMMKDFNELSKNDPTLKEDKFAVEKLGSRKQEFVTMLKETNQYESVRKGVLPPGVMKKAWKNQDSTFSYGVAVYMPSASNNAASAARDMQDAKILQPVETQPTGVQTDSNKGFQDTSNPNVTKPSTEVKPVQGGKVQNENDL